MTFLCKKSGFRKSARINIFLRQSGPIALLENNKKQAERAMDKYLAHSACFFQVMAGPTGLEPATSGVTGRRSKPN